VPNEIEVPPLTYAQLRSRADDFLTTYHSSQVLPIPIEEIIEFRLRINIVPVPGLRKAFDVEAFPSSDCKEITIDRIIFEKELNRYRFGLAHELGHIILHRHLFRNVIFKTIDQWINFIGELPAEQHYLLEYQARSFAGLVLVPCTQLATETMNAVSKALTSGVNISPSDKAAWDYIVVASFLEH
jgi:hypothetical protein